MGDTFTEKAPNGDESLSKHAEDYITYGHVDKPDAPQEGIGSPEER